MHLPFEQPDYNESGKESEALEKANYKETTLTAWFKLNPKDFQALVITIGL